MKNEKLENWFCTIGPVYRKQIPWGGDAPLRAAVKDRFIEMFGKQADICGSGWGLAEEMKTRLDIISFLPSLPEGAEILKQIDELLAKR